MLSFKTGLHLCLGLFGAIAVAVGCAASPTDDGDPASGSLPTDPAKQDAGAGPSKKLNAPNKDGGSSSSSSSSGGGDDDDTIGGPDDDGGSTGSSSSSSSGSVDAGMDSGPTAPEAGDSCTTQDQLYTRVCGFCGKQQAICTTNRTGALQVSDYGPCGSESGVCKTGDTQPCGKCGTKTCSSTCGWGTCKNEGVCKPGVVTHDSVGCPTVGTYRSKTCDDTCNYGNYSACEAPDLVVPPQGQTISGQWELTTASKGKRPSACKKTATLTPVTGFSIPLHNNSSTDAVVQIWHTSAGTSLDTVVATYPMNPMSDDDFRACLTEPQDGCSQLNDICTVDGSGSFAGVDNVKVPANSTIWIYSSGWLNTTTGKFVLNVKTK
jgi:hypothetical protein